MRRTGAATAAVLMLVTAGCTGSPPAPRGPAPTTVPPAATGRPAPTTAPTTPDPNMFDVPYEVGSVALSGGAVWTLPHRNPFAVRIDPATRRTTQIRLPGIGAELSATGTEIWASISAPGTFDPMALARIDTVRRKVTVTVPVPAVSPQIIGDRVWAVGVDGTLYALNRADGKRLKTISTGLNGAGINTTGGYLWVEGSDKTLRVDSRTYAITDVTARVGSDTPLVAGAAGCGRPPGTRAWSRTRRT